MLYLFDANVLITASNTYYPVEDIPEFWAWLHHHGTAGNIKLPLEILEEIMAGSKNEDPLLRWMKEPEHQDALRLYEAVDQGAVQHVVKNGYAPDLTDDQFEALGRDPFLIAYAFTVVGARTVVTTEVSSPGKQRQNRKIPDVCNGFGIPCCNPFVAYKALGFRTNWKP